MTRSYAFTHIVFASSSGGTQAGLMLGKEVFKQNYQVVGINIDKDETAEHAFLQQVLALANRTARRLKLNHELTESDLILKNHYVGAGYGVIGELEKEAIILTAQTEGILLDLVYTGRAWEDLLI
ncbi:hypothetical protein [Candidatus Albibeggiatoa sp. nov. BB20]|uniref:hypothetical protein n=1 Tax=Candidatus Albibeggiatoa sp. nov. BB20 TaxID=3162723 RepID=UPI0033657358